MKFYDFDNDGDFDALLSGIAQIDNFNNWDDFHFFLEIQYNTGDIHHPQFGPRESIFESFPYPHGYFLPSPGDLNDDGITDFIVGADIDYIGNQTFYISKA